MSQIAFLIDSFSVHWYGIMIAAAALVSVIIALLCRKAQGRDHRPVLFVAVVGSILSICFARIIHWYCCTGQYADFRAAVIDPKTGGFSILGVFIGCATAVFLALYMNVEHSIGELFDCMAPAGAIGICIGRMGSAFTTSDRGKLIITKPAFQRFPFAVQMSEGSGGEWQFATFVFEAVAAFIAFLIVMRVFSATYFGPSKHASPHKGDAALVFIAFFGATQAVLESTKYDALFLRSNGFISLMQIVSSVALVAVLVVFSVRAVRNHRIRKEFVVMWILSFLLIGLAILFEYLVQRYGNLYVYFYAGMFACMLSVFFITRAFFRRSLDTRAAKR